MNNIYFKFNVKYIISYKEFELKYIFIMLKKNLWIDS